MQRIEHIGKPVSRITCSVHHRLGESVSAHLRTLGIKPVLMEIGRAVRLRRCRRLFGLAGTRNRMEDSQMVLFSFNVNRDQTRQVMQSVINAVEIDVAGRGTLFAQETIEYVGEVVEDVLFPETAHDKESLMLSDLSLITCIISMRGSGEQLAGLALELGTGVPMITFGTGSGLRDRLGLLRITIPQEKDMVHLLVPEIDAEGVVNQLVEEGRLNRPGRGFIYSTPVQMGVLDTRLQIGAQQHAASMEQMIAAIDELKKGTAWRRRFPSLDQVNNFKLLRHQSEITLTCPEEQSTEFIEAAFKAGAQGATTARVRRMRGEDMQGVTAARERVTIAVPAAIESSVIKAILGENTDTLDSLQTIPAPLAYSYRV